MNASVDIQMISLKNLRHHESNVRTPSDGNPAMLEADAQLRASIMAHGLEQNLVVVPTTNTLFGVVAGGRRLTALQELAEAGEIPKDTPVPCRIDDAGKARELSLAENTVRVAMSPQDQCEAFAKLAEEGATSAEIAERFGVPERTVRQRVRIGSLHPEIFQAYRERRIRQDTAEAFASTENAELQLTVFKAANASNQLYGHAVRTMLAEHQTSSESAMAHFVGEEAYVAAGGRIDQPLFDDNATWIDREILLHLAQEKLDAEAARHEGDWKWTSTLFSYGWNEEQDYLVVAPWKRGKLTEAEEQDYETAAADLEGDGERLQHDDALRGAEREALEKSYMERIARLNELDFLRADRSVFSKNARAHGGVVVHIDGDGDMIVRKGMIRKEDQAAYRKATSTATIEGETAPPDAPKEAGGYSNALKADFSYIRKMAVQHALAHRPLVAQDLVAFVLARDIARLGDGESGYVPATLNVRRDNDYFGGSNQLKDSGWMDRLAPKPKAVDLSFLDLENEAEAFDAFRELQLPEREVVLAFSVANLLRNFQAGDPAETDLHARIVKVLDIDFAKMLRSISVNPFDEKVVLNRMNKAQILQVARDAGIDDEWINARTKMKKGDVAEQTAKKLADMKSDWLPPMIAAPKNEGASPPAVDRDAEGREGEESSIDNGGEDKDS